jgi:hypothetical protein
VSSSLDSTSSALGRIVGEGKQRVVQIVALTMNYGAPEEIRTPDPQIRSLEAYPKPVIGKLQSRITVRPKSATIGAKYRLSITDNTELIVR